MKAKLYAAGFAALLILAAGAMGWWKWHNARLITIGINQEKVRALDERDVALRQRDSLLAVGQVAASDTFIQWRTRWRDSIVTQRFTDTLVHRDTVIRIVAAADSTISACDAALSACNLRVQSLLGIVANRDSVLAIVQGARSVKPSRFGVYVGAGSCAAWSGHGVAPALCVGVSVGLRVW